MLLPVDPSDAYRTVERFVVGDPGLRRLGANLPISYPSELGTIVSGGGVVVGDGEVQVSIDSEFEKAVRCHCSVPGDVEDSDWAGDSDATVDVGRPDLHSYLALAGTASVK